MLSPEVDTEITDLNIGYLVLAQRLLRQDRPAAMLRLGLTRPQADFIERLALPEILRMSSSRAPLCGPRLDELMPSVFDTGHAEQWQQAHLFIVMAARRAQAQCAAAQAVAA